MMDFQLLSLITARNNIFMQTHIVRKQEGNAGFGELFALIIQLLDCPIFFNFSQTPAYPKMGRDTLTRYTLPLHYWMIYECKLPETEKTSNLTSRHWPSNYFGNVAQPLRNHPSIYHQPGSCCPIPLYSLVFFAGKKIMVNTMIFS